MAGDTIRSDARRSDHVKLPGPTKTHHTRLAAEREVIKIKEANLKIIDDAASFSNLHTHRYTHGIVM